MEIQLEEDSCEQHTACSCLLPVQCLQKDASGLNLVEKGVRDIIPRVFDPVFQADVKQRRQEIADKAVQITAVEEEVAAVEAEQQAHPAVVELPAAAGSSSSAMALKPVIDVEKVQQISAAGLLQLLVEAANKIPAAAAASVAAPAPAAAAKPAGKKRRVSDAGSMSTVDVRGLTSTCPLPLLPTTPLQAVEESDDEDDDEDDDGSSEDGLGDEEKEEEDDNAVGDEEAEPAAEGASATSAAGASKAPQPRVAVSGRIEKVKVYTATAQLQRIAAEFVVALGQNRKKRLVGLQADALSVVQEAMETAEDEGDAVSFASFTSLYEHLTKDASAALQKMGGIVPEGSKRQRRVGAM
jgi:hypothetical protein